MGDPYVTPDGRHVPHYRGQDPAEAIAEAEGYRPHLVCESSVEVEVTVEEEEA